MKGLELRKIRKLLKLNQKEFSEKLDISDKTLYNWEQKEELSEKAVRLVDYFLETLPFNIEDIDAELNPDGIDHQFTVSEPTLKYSKSNAHPQDSETMLIPLVPIPAQAGYLGGYGDREYLDELPKYPVLKRPQEHLFKVFVIEGDSMNDGTTRAICEQDKVLAKQLLYDMWETIFTNRTFIIVSKSEGIICKEITQYNKESKTITCSSYNKNFKDFNLTLGDDVVELYYVKDVIRNVG